MSFIAIGTYRYIIALIYGVRVMPIMDVATFLGSEESRPNIMCSILLEKQTFEKASERFKNLMAKLPKTRYSIVKIFGDYYY